ncbi:protein phosphatase methylesterase 1-like [Centruroides vittatus]|uniref:protein phosphatase methylesterase 1-like n=1 Tax=Centruroides vittatus TaxID=120091 RepID=UPI00350EBE84
MSSLHKQIARGRLPPIPPISLNGNPRAGRRGMKRDYSPLSWKKYFTSMKEIKVTESNIFRVYCNGESGPLLLLLHGGGYSGLTWSLFTSNISHLVECQIAAIDLRGHGETKTTNDSDLSAETLSRDVGNVIQNMYGSENLPPVILIGHSMGGAVAVHVVHQDLIPTCIGLVVIDVVEGTAMEALQSMQSFLRSRPSSFPTIENAVEWCVRSGQVRNIESARVSMPGQLKCCDSNLPATTQLNEDSELENATNSNQSNVTESSILMSNAILEEDEELTENKTNNDKIVTPPDFKIPKSPIRNNQFTWRIDLSKTEKYWGGWFEGLSEMFLSSSVPKLLLLAGVDRLDKVLTIGQMQGKFQMQVLSQCGHAIHEDEPDKVAEAIATFVVRHKFATPTSNFQRTFPAC